MPRYSRYSRKYKRGGSPSKPQGNNNSHNANTISGEDIVTEQPEYMIAEPNNSNAKPYQDMRAENWRGLNKEELDEYHKKMQEGNLKAYRDKYGRQGEFNRIYDENDEDNDDDEYPERFDGGKKRRKTNKRRYGGYTTQQVVNIQARNRNNNGVQPLPPELLEPEQMDGQQLIQRRYRDHPFYRPEVDNQVILPPLPNFNYPPPPVPQGWQVQPTAPDISEMVRNRQVGGKRKHTKRTRHVKKYLRKGSRTLRRGKSKKTLKRKN